MMADTLRALTFSYQNITPLSGTLTYTLHRKLQDWTEALIGKDSLEQKQRLAEYLYNRCAFMLEIQHASCEEQVSSYASVMKLFEESFSAQDPVLVKKKAQISNMQGCIIDRSGQESARRKAEPYFVKAYKLYSSIPRDKFLIGNVLTGLIDCLANEPLDEISANSLKKYVDELCVICGEFKAEGNAHCYVGSYPQSIEKARKALEKYQGTA